MFRLKPAQETNLSALHLIIIIAFIYYFTRSSKNKILKGQQIKIKANRHCGYLNLNDSTRVRLSIIFRINAVSDIDITTTSDCNKPKWIAPICYLLRSGVFCWWIWRETTLSKGIRTTDLTLRQFSKQINRNLPRYLIIWALYIKKGSSSVQVVRTAAAKVENVCIVNCIYCTSTFLPKTKKFCYYY